MRIAAFCFLLLPIAAIGQKGPFSLTNKVKLDRALFAFRSKTYVDFDTLRMVKNISEMRMALMISDSLNTKCSFRIFGSLTVAKQNYSNSSAELILKPGKKVKINFGYTATLTTELRPNPTVPESLIESMPQASIIGARPTAKLQYKWTDHFSTGIGTSYHDTAVAIHAAVSFKNLRMAGYVSKHEFFVASDARFKHIDYSWIYRNTGVFSIAFFVKLKKNFTSFVDMQIPVKKGGSRAIGIRKHFSDKSGIVHGFLETSFDLHSNLLSLQYYFHI